MALGRPRGCRRRGKSSETRARAFSTQRSGGASLGETYLSWNPKEGKEPDAQSGAGMRHQAKRTARARRGPEAAPARRVQNRSGRGVRGAWAPCPARPATAGAAPLPGRAPALPPLCRGPAEGGRRAASQSARAGAQVRTRAPAPTPRARQRHRAGHRRRRHEQHQSGSFPLELSELGFLRNRSLLQRRGGLRRCDRCASRQP